jgi:hypothetical protein
VATRQDRVDKGKIGKLLWEKTSVARNRIHGQTNICNDIVDSTARLSVWPTYLHQLTIVCPKSSVVFNHLYLHHNELNRGRFGLIRILKARRKAKTARTAREFDCGRDTLSRRYRNVRGSRDAQYQSQRLLDDQQEKSLVKYIDGISTLRTGVGWGGVGFDPRPPPHDPPCTPGATGWGGVGKWGL